MSDGQDIISLGLNMDSFDNNKMEILRKYIQLFTDLSKFDGKIFNPVMGDGLTTFNTSIAQTNKLIDEMNGKLAALNAAQSASSSSSKNAATSNTELGLAMREYAKNVDQAATNQAKLTVLTSEQAKANMVLKLQLSETTKAMFEEIKGTQQATAAKEKAKIIEQEYRLEKERVVATLRALAVEQDKQDKANIIASENAKKVAAEAYRIEQERVVATLRKLAIEQDQKAAADRKESLNQKNLLSDYEKLRIALKNQANEYERLFLAKGKDHAMTKAALADYASTAGVINKIDGNLNKAGAGASGMSKGLGTAFGHLRNIAYILPGLGIAGIFNLAFEAIENVIDAVGLFDKKQNDLIITNTALNNSIAEQIKLYSEMESLRRSFHENYAGISYTGFNPLGTLTDKQLALDANTARGLSQDKLLKQSVETAQKRLDNVTNRVNDTGTFSNPDGSLARVPTASSINNIKEQINRVLFDLGSAQAQSNRIATDIGRKGRNEYGDKHFSVDELKLQKEEQDSLIAFNKNKYDVLNALLKEYFDATNSLQKAKNTLTKFNEDEERKFQFETAKNAVAVNIDKNKKILDSDKKFYEDKESAILKNFEEEKKLNQAAYANVVNNISSTPRDKGIASSNLTTQNNIAERRRDVSLDKNKIEFYQRRLLAITEIQKDEIEMSAISDERIFLNEKHTLQERLDAYENYIVSRQRIKDLEHNLAIQRGAADEGGATSLTEDEKRRIDVHRNTQKFNIQADAEKQTYNIVKSSLDAQLKLVEDANNKEADIDKEAYIKELNANNARFKGKIFQYEAYKRNYDFINKKYKVILSVEDEIKDSEEDVSRLRSLYEDLNEMKEKSDDQLSKKKGDLENERARGGDVLNSERFFDEELGRNNALNDAILKSKKDLNDEIAKGDDARIRQAKAKYEEEIQFEKEYSANMKKIKEDLWDFAGLMINRNVENELQSIQDIQESRNEQFELQKDAVEKSSLNAKDKTALDIQLNQQKIESDKQAEAEERKIKREAAERDKQLSLARVVINGIESVSAALKLPPPAGEILAAQRGILATIAAAQILAVPIPSYAEGTDFHPGGKARFGEDGPEIVKEPGKPAYVQLTETISYLPKGTQVIPIKDNSPEFMENKSDDSWEQTRFLAKQIKKSNKEITNVFKPTIVVDMNFESRKRQILGN